MSSTLGNIAIDALNKLREDFSDIFDLLENVTVSYEIISAISFHGIANTLYNAVTNAFTSETMGSIPSIFNFDAVLSRVTSSSINYGGNSNLGSGTVVVSSSFTYTRTFGDISSNDTTCTYTDEGISVTRDIKTYSVSRSQVYFNNGELSSSMASFVRFSSLRQFEDKLIKVITRNHGYLPSVNAATCTSLSL